jgi:membrane associated rhomboid family serine protease
MIAKKGFRTLLIAVAIAWGVHVFNVMTAYSLLRFGLVPRVPEGAIGILTAPFLHGSLFHILSNTVPFLIMGFLLMLDGVRRWWTVTLGVMLLGGGAVWAFGRAVTHVGASGVVFGYFGYLLAHGVVKRDFKSILIAVVTAVGYGGLIWGVLPLRAGISFESHLFGFIAGIAIAAYFGRK